MTTHELAHQLLERPDHTVTVGSECRRQATICTEVTNDVMCFLVEDETAIAYEERDLVTIHNQPDRTVLLPRLRG